MGGRYFPQDGLYSEQENGSLSLTVQPEWRKTFKQDQKLTIIPFYRFDSEDKQRSHADIRQLDLNFISGDFEFQVGISKEFWGVTESQHLIDIINQTDLIEGIDGEDKLGQPMLRINRHFDNGSLGLYVLPYFRERTYPGIKGRFRSSLVVDTNSPLYESSSKEKHIDYALRWRQTIGDFDIGLSWFDGTSREPELIQVGNTLVAHPYYRQIQQLSLDMQYTKEAWLWKIEALRRKNKDTGFNAAVIGVEYIIDNINSTRSDLGIIAEYNIDTRDELAPSALENDLFLGVRLSFNDVNSTTLLVRGIFDLDYNSKSLRLEASRRIGDNIKLELTAQSLTSIDSQDQVLDAIKADDFIQLEIQRYF